MTKHFIKRVKERLDTQASRRLLSLCAAMLRKGLIPKEGKHRLDGYGTVIVKGGVLVTFLDPEMA